jgi:hypothetical protein
MAMRTYHGVVLFAIVVGASLNSMPAAAQSTCPASFAQFICPLVPGDVVVARPTCLEKNCVLHQVRIERGGELLIPDEKQRAEPRKINISATAIFIEDGGVFQVGPLANNRLALIFTGARPAPAVADRDGPDDPCPSAHFYKGIEVCRGGTLRLLGTKGVPALGGTTWTYLSAPAGDPAKYGANIIQPGNTLAPIKVTAPVTQPDAQTVQIATDVTDWQPGDWIVIGSSSSAPYETEFVQIKALVGTTITLDQPLKYYHSGGPAPASGLSRICEDTSARVLPGAPCDGSDKNHGVDERAEVELISRDIVLTSDAGLAGTDGFGGDIKIRPGFTQVLVQGVQLENLSPDAATALVEAEKPNIQSRAPTEPPPAAPVAPVVPPPAVPIVPPPAAPTVPALASRIEQSGHPYASLDRIPEKTVPLLRIPGARLRDSYRKSRR